MKRVAVSLCVAVALVACASKEPATVTVTPASPSAAASASGSLLPAPSATRSTRAHDGVTIEVRGANVLVEGNIVALDAVAASLKRIRALWMQLHPGQAFPGQCTVTADGATPAAVVKRIVRAAAEAGYPNVALAVR